MSGATSIDGDGAGSQGATSGNGRRCRRAIFDRDPTLPTGWSVSSECHSGKRTVLSAPRLPTAEALGRPLAELPIDDLRKFEPRITEDVYSVLSTEASVASRTSFGGAAPDRVLAAIDDARQRFLSRGAT